LSLVCGNTCVNGCHGYQLAKQMALLNYDYTVEAMLCLPFAIYTMEVFRFVLLWNIGYNEAGIFSPCY